MGRPLQQKNLPALGHVPDLHRFVQTSRGQPLAIGAERNASNLGRVSLQDQTGSAAGLVPDLDRCIHAGRSELLPIRAECHALYLKTIFDDHRRFSAG